MHDDRLRDKGTALRRAVIALAALVSVPCLAQEMPKPDCLYFRGARGIAVGGHEDNTPVIPVAIDELTIDLRQHQACHALRWSIYTVKGISQDKVCFDIGEQAKDDKVAVSATFPTGVTAQVVELSALKDRAIAEELATACRMHSAAPPAGRAPREGIDL
jgi:hypothetical protein